MLKEPPPRSKLTWETSNLFRKRHLASNSATNASRQSTPLHTQTSPCLRSNRACPEKCIYDPLRLYSNRLYTESPVFDSSVVWFLLKKWFLQWYQMSNVSVSKYYKFEAALSSATSWAVSNVENGVS